MEKFKPCKGDIQMNTEKDIRRLNLLGTLHYVLGGLTALFAFALLIATVISGIVLKNPERDWGHKDDATDSTLTETTSLLENGDHNDNEKDITPTHSSDELDNDLEVSGFALGFVTAMIIYFAIIGAFFTGLAICLLISGRKLRQRKSRTFSMVIAGIGCLMVLSALSGYDVSVKIISVLFPVLGVFTLITLNKKSVKELYDNHQNTFI